MAAIFLSSSSLGKSQHFLGLTDYIISKDGFTQWGGDILSVLSDLIDVVDLGESDDLLVADLVIVILLGNADGVEEIEILGNFDLLGGNLPEFLVGQGDLHAVEHVEPRISFSNVSHTIRGSH